MYSTQRLMHSLQMWKHQINQRQWRKHSVVEDSSKDSNGSKKANTSLSSSVPVASRPTWVGALSVTHRRLQSQPKWQVCAIVYLSRSFHHCHQPLSTEPLKLTSKIQTLGKRVYHKMTYTSCSYWMKEYRARKNLSCFRLLCQILYMGTALNGHLLTGPDLTDSLTGGLCRFHNRLISIESVEEAIQMVRVVQNVCAKGRLRLHKFISNKRSLGLYPWQWTS